MALRVFYGVDCGIDVSRLVDVANIVEERSGVPRPLEQPIIGPYAFLTDGAYWAAEADLLFGERVHATFPISPETVGGRERVVWSDRTITQESIRLRALQAGIAEQDMAAIEDIVENLRTTTMTAPRYPGWLEDDSFPSLLKRHK
jgi:2-isopropylmalate synthase